MCGVCVDTCNQCLHYLSLKMDSAPRRTHTQPLRALTLTQPLRAHTHTTITRADTRLLRARR